MNEVTLSRANALAVATTLLEQARGWTIETAEDCDAAAMDLRRIKGMAKAAEEKRLEEGKPYRNALDDIQEFYKGPLGMLKEAAQLLENAILRRRQAIEAERREAERAARAAREAQERAEREARAKAAELAEADRVDEAIEVMAAIPAPIVAAAPPPEIPKLEGVHTRTTWSGEVDDFMALVQAVAAGKAPQDLLAVNMKRLNEIARGMKGAMQIPGCRAVESTSVVARAA